jgi:hypothetical protein
MRLLRRVTGIQAATETDAISCWMRTYTAAVFRSVLVVYEVLEPLLGCGFTRAAPAAAPQH